jgi:hypothetical protein
MTVVTKRNVHTLIQQFPPPEDSPLSSLRSAILDHLATIGLSLDHAANGSLSKETIRSVHIAHRRQAAEAERSLIQRRGSRLLSHFADGTEIDVTRVSPYLIEVLPHSPDADLFRAATLLWSVPVSRGFGRRIRFLLKDAQNDKLIGILALGDPVFNLSCRDKWIGWNLQQRTDRLVNLLDAYVLGAVPPYSMLIGGKLVAASIASREVSEAFARKYNGSVGIIAGKAKQAQLALVTTTSSLGRSSLYNRLKLPGLFEYKRIGVTEGWGHFQVPDPIFYAFRDLLSAEGHRYANGHNYGSGPNWRVRVIRAALKRLGLSENLLRHGIRREVFALPLADNWQDYLCARSDHAKLSRPALSTIAEAAIARWLLPRSLNDPSYRDWTRADTLSLIMNHFTLPPSVNASFSFNIDPSEPGSQHPTAVAS